MTGRTVQQLAAMTDRVALVTGGAGHVGLVLCDALEELGATVASADLELKANAAGGDASSQRHFLPVDLRNEAEIRGLIRQVLSTCGRLDVVVHCAAYVGSAKREGWDVPFAEQSVAAWDDAVRVNLTAAFVLAQAARQALEASGHGSLVFVSSIYGLVGPDFSLYEGTDMHNPAAYGASKGGLLQLARYLATEFAPRVRVNSLSPGGVWRKQPEAFVNRYSTRTPLGRMAVEEDLKGAIAFLASDLSEYVTGHNLVVDGGWTAW